MENIIYSIKNIKYDMVISKKTKKKKSHYISDNC